MASPRLRCARSTRFRHPRSGHARAQPPTPGFAPASKKAPVGACKCLTLVVRCRVTIHLINNTPSFDSCPQSCPQSLWLASELPDRHTTIAHGLDWRRQHHAKRTSSRRLGVAQTRPVFHVCHAGQQCRAGYQCWPSCRASRLGHQSGLQKIQAGSASWHASPSARVPRIALQGWVNSDDSAQSGGSLHEYPVAQDCGVITRMCASAQVLVGNLRSGKVEIHLLLPDSWARS